MRVYLNNNVVIKLQNLERLYVRDHKNKCSDQRVKHVRNQPLFIHVPFRHQHEPAEYAPASKHPRSMLISKLGWIVDKYYWRNDHTFACQWIWSGKTESKVAIRLMLDEIGVTCDRNSVAHGDCRIKRHCVVFRGSS